MADSTSPIQQVTAGAGAADRVNENFDAGSAAMMYGRDGRTTTALTWGYVGGRWGGTSIANGTVSLTASNTNYVVVNLSTGAVSVSTATTNWNDSAYGHAYKITTGASAVTSYEDHRAGPSGVSGGGGGSSSGLTIASKSADYTAVLGDANTALLHPSADTTARTFTIPANASVAYPVGTCLTFINQHSGGGISIAITSDTMRLAGAGTTGTRALAADGIATALKITSTEWLISGTNLT